MLTPDQAPYATGPEDARIVILTDSPYYEDLVSGSLMSSFAGRLLFDQFRTHGIGKAKLRIESVLRTIPPGRAWYKLDKAVQTEARADAFARMRLLAPNVFVPLGDLALSVLTDKVSSDKWHLSILPTLIARADGSPVKCVPLLHPDRILKTYKDMPFLAIGAERIAHEAQFPELRYVARDLRVRPSLSEALAFLAECERAPWLSVDIETGYGQITCLSFAPSATLCLSIPTLPSQWPADEFHVLWSAIGRALASPARKIFQNGIYDTSYFSKYGLRVANFAHDTMLAQKFLFPELAMGLDTCARIYTTEPYWKDDAKDWGARQDIEQLWRYNAKDSAVTYEIAMAQRLDLARRKPADEFARTFTERVQAMTGPVEEMCWRGIAVDEAEKARLTVETQARITEHQAALDVATTAIGAGTINPRSHVQVKNLLKKSGFRLPIKKGQESSDRESLLRLRLKKPDSAILTALIDLSYEQKILSSYLGFRPDADGRMRYTLLAHGTETGRMSCVTDPFGNGLNAQTIPSELKTMFVARPGHVLVEVDLSQAESRFVAWDAPEPTLIRMFTNGEDVHRFVASQPELFNCLAPAVTHDQRQLGKKVGHASNYAVGPGTLAMSCLKEMDLVLPESRAAQMLDGYYRTFPGIRQWHARIRDEVTRTRKLTTPFGRERQFYDRLGDSLFREAYAYKPQSFVPDVINALIRHLRGHVALLLQVHDSTLLEVPEDALPALMSLICDQDAWNPPIRLAGGELRIPIEVKSGVCWGRMSKVYAG